MKRTPALPMKAGMALGLMALVTAGWAQPPSEARPSIVKDSVQVSAFTIAAYKGRYDTWSWVPSIRYQVNGPIASGSQLQVEFKLPGAGAPVKFNCDTGPIEKGAWWQTQCSGRGIPEEKATTQTGDASFTIRLRNELQGTDTALFTGKVQVGKVRSNEEGPGSAGKVIYVVDQDWNLPIGYVYCTAHQARGWNKPQLNVAFWTRGEAAAGFEPHLMYQGKEVGRILDNGQEIGKPACGEEVTHAPTRPVHASVPQRARWDRVRCTFPMVLRWDKSGDPAMYPPHLLAAHPGEYELKVLWRGQLSRTIRFTVGPDGQLDNSLAAENQLGRERMIVPVQIGAGPDGSWNRNAWRTQAFHGHPLVGFAAAP